jgi:hypothetical protein
VNGVPDAQELAVIHVLGKVQRESCVKMIGMLCAEGDDVGTMESTVLNPAFVAPALGRAHKRFGEVDPDITAHARTDELEKDAIAAPEVGHDFVARQLEEWQHAPNSTDGMRVVVIDVALIVECAELFFRPRDGSAPACHGS